MATAPPQVLGSRGEIAAVSLLRKLGWKILDTRFRNRFGEIDIIAQDGAVTVFTEVKTRTSTSDGEPFEAVDRRRRQRLTLRRTRMAQIPQQTRPARSLRYHLHRLAKGLQRTSDHPLPKRFPGGLHRTNVLVPGNLARPDQSRTDRIPFSGIQVIPTKAQIIPRNSLPITRSLLSLLLQGA
ncbi:MAG UNVERIFIED_CONTAM: YraN family protein [Planctomycetaceae bacterium]